MNTDEVEVIEPEKVGGGGGEVKEAARRAVGGSSPKERKAAAAAFIDDEAKEERKKRKAGATKEKEKKTSKKRKRVEISDDEEEEVEEEEDDDDDDEEEDEEEQSDEDEEESECDDGAEEDSTDDGDEEEEEEEDSSDDEDAKKKKKKTEKKKKSKKAEPMKKKARDGEKKKKKAGGSTKSKALKASTMAKLAKAVYFLLSNAHFPFAVSSTVVVEYVRASEHACAPLVGSENAAGADLCAAEECFVPAGGRRLVSTGLRVAIPHGFYGRIAPRSGLAVKHFIDVGAGVVDADYRGELKVLLFNFGSEGFKIKIGDRIAQLICEQIAHPMLAEVECLSGTKRGPAGFGSTVEANAVNDDWKAMGRRFGSTMHQCTECSEQQKKRLPREWKGHIVFETIQCASCVAGNKAMQAAYYRHFSKFAKK
ncbi:DeoxyUTP pyrophosphatase [Aphelenchoides avenae]|nr:DeoxyUTP pyrophosphatase [Aphelenchus avenae]